MRKEKALGYVIMLKDCEALACGMSENGILWRDDETAMVIKDRKKANRIIQASIRARGKKNLSLGINLADYSIIRLVEDVD